VKGRILAIAYAAVLVAICVVAVDSSPWMVRSVARGILIAAGVMIWCALAVPTILAHWRGFPKQTSGTSDPRLLTIEQQQALERYVQGATSIRVHPEAREVFDALGLGTFCRNDDEAEYVGRWLLAQDARLRGAE
jgi:hypothetical protein